MQEDHSILRREFNKQKIRTIINEEPYNCKLSLRQVLLKEGKFRQQRSKISQYWGAIYEISV